MSIEEENKEVLNRFFEFFNRGDLEACSELVSPGFITHRTTGDVTREDFFKGSELLLVNFTGLSCTIEHVVAEGDKVVNRWSVSGTHKGEFMGVAPTGKRVTITGIQICRIVDSKVVEDWTEADFMGLMQQLSAVPQPGH